MATKQINQLPAGTSVTDTSFFADEDSSNANVTQKLSALQMYTYLLTKNPSAHKIMLSQAGGGVTGLTLTNGQLAIGSTGADPVAANITAGTGVTVTNSPGAITISANTSQNFPIVSVTAANKTFALTDANTYQVCNSASNQALQVPINASVAFTTGTEIFVQQTGAGVVSITAAGGVTISSPYSSTIILSKGSEGKLKYLGTDSWLFIPYSSEIGQGATLITSASFTIPNAVVMPPTQTWVLESGNLNSITVTLPSSAFRGETHRFICRNIGFNCTIAAAGLFDIVGMMISNVTGIAHISDYTSIATISLENTGINNQVVELTMDGSHWVLGHNIGFTTP